MGMLREMFGDEGNNSNVRAGEFLARGNYISNAEEILRGYKVYWKKYVLKSLIPRFIIAALAITSSLMMVISDPSSMISILCLMISVFVTIYFISVPVVNRKNLSKGLDSLSGTEYEAEFYTDKVKISTLKLETDIVEIEKTEESEKKSEQTEVDLYTDGEDSEIPATIIHLDSPIVDILDKNDMFILVVKKSYVFIIPKSAFSEEQNKKIFEKLSVIMGIRYRELD